MKLLFQISIASVCFIYLLHIAHTGSGTSKTTQVLNPLWSYCFEFTWFGPEFDNTTRYNGTCEDYLEERGGGVPCKPPIVITYNGTFPDIDYLWKYHQTSIVCRRSNGQVCARYAFYYSNGQMKNATYMCTKVQVVGEDSVTKGCFTQKIKDVEVEVCACQSGVGIYKPCNIHF